MSIYTDTHTHLTVTCQVLIFCGTSHSAPRLIGKLKKDNKPYFKDIRLNLKYNVLDGIYDTTRRKSDIRLLQLSSQNKSLNCLEVWNKCSV